MKKIILSIVGVAAVVVAGDFYLSRKYYSLGFDTAEQHYMKMLAKEGYAFFDPKTGEWRLVPKVNRDPDDLDTYVYTLETELNLVKTQLEAQQIERKRFKR